MLGNLPTLRKIRLIAAIVLVCAIFLPLSECSLLRNDYSRAYGYEYVYSSFGVIFGVITVLAFSWPLIFVLFLRKRDRFRSQLFLQLLELLLCAGTIYWLNALAAGERWLYGFYLGVTAAAGFTAAGLAWWFFGRRGVAERAEQLEGSRT
jgi:hypothetical protein